MKQFYDVSTLADEFAEFDCVRKTYFSVCQAEIGYRGIDITPADALRDTIQAAKCIGSRGKIGREDFPHFLRASRDVSHHIYETGFSMEQAMRMAPKIICLAACLLADKPFTRIIDPEPYREKQLSDSDLLQMKTMRRVDLKAYAYLIEADQILVATES